MLFVGPIFIVLEVEVPGVIGTGDHTVPAPYAPVVIHDNDSVIPLVRGLNRTDLGARRGVAVIT
jgi:hypothetical protein